MAVQGWEEPLLREFISCISSSAFKSFTAGKALSKYGRLMDQVRSLPDELPRGTLGRCYGNAVTALMRAGPDGFGRLRYVEGYAVSQGEVSIPIAHAWLVDEDGKVVDPTWEDAHDHVYFGVAFKTEFVLSMLEVADMEPGLFVWPALMRKHFGTQALFEAALDERYHPECAEAA